MKSYDPEETSRIIGLLFVIVIIYLLVFNALVNPAETVYIKEGNVYKGFFTEPFETMLFIFKNGDFIAFTNQYEKKVHLPIGYLEEYLKKQNKKIEDIVIAIHNHNIPARFSPKNNKYYHQLKWKGFKGYFCIYYPFDGKVRILKD